MTKLNWRNAKEELPKQINNSSYECLIVVLYIHNNKLCSRVTSSYFRFDHEGKLIWENVDNDEIATHWLPMRETPLPEE